MSEQSWVWYVCYGVFVQWCDVRGGVRSRLYQKSCVWYVYYGVCIRMHVYVFVYICVHAPTCIACTCMHARCDGEREGEG